MSTPTREAHAPRWQKWLGHLKDTPATGLELGTWRGESAEVMLEDYFTHPDSRYYCVDHFQGSPEHHRLNVDCSHLEREARQRLEKFGYRAQILKMDTAHAMKNFLKDLKFDAIYVDASHDAISVLRDTILAWDLLKVGGTMIWDDYEWQVFDQPLDCPRIAIDAFLAIYARRYTILEPKCWQIAVTKTA